MMKLRVLSFSLITLVAISYYSCASSTANRYNNDTKVNTETTTSNENEAIVKTEKDIKLSEDFDITPYKTKVEIPDNNEDKTFNESDIWYDYSSSNNENKQKVLAGTEEGYRVLVTSTDNLDDANQIKSEIINSVSDNEVYIDFEPPFYKVKVGDFKNQKYAENLRFKLNQLGYTEAKVTKETINIFK